jgi:putative DNA primase/helicase
MQHNRILRISTAGSRKATYWPKSEITWSDFTEKLKTPIRSVESLEEYLALPKSKQDELKDVGGFVGGTFKGDRRLLMWKDEI